VSIPSDVHLVGHSDADAICHAVTDALLGAAGAGDIGAIFPDSDAANRGRSSIEMLSLAAGSAITSGWSISNIDVTLVAEQPRIGPYRTAICQRIADALGVSASQVSVKGKSNEGMGWIGRGEGLACLAVATLVRQSS
jgi:2-C-methyl-D-erythritol 2,4-cyclodiphosphate synthase